LIVSPSEFATILAALRFFQDEFQTVEPAELAELFPQFETAAPLSWTEIGSLCERLNIPEPAEDDELCDCETPGFFYAGVPGILAHLKDGRVAPGALVERCDRCCRFASDEEALAKIQELGIAERSSVLPESKREVHADENGLLLEARGQELFCDFCEARAISRRVISRERLHDDARNLCHSCDAAFMLGVEHGRHDPAGRTAAVTKATEELQPCDECGQVIPELQNGQDGGSIVNSQHLPSCSLHDPKEK
jgi:hypothetical protein